MTPLAKLFRLWHTLRYLQPVQVYGRLWFRLYRPRPNPRPAPGVRARSGSWVACSRAQRQTGPATFSFIGQERSVHSPGDWNRADWPKLWVYNLHYFDDLCAARAETRRAWHEEIIDRWNRENPPAFGNGWEPYPISLRLVNWCKWMMSGNQPVSGMADSMAVQVRYLRKRLERHLLGNHLWANLKALIFVGTYFEGDEADAWRKAGLQAFRRQVSEQILADGGHFERSPMYHAILLEDLLDLIQLGQRYPGALPLDDVAGWQQAAARMLRWLQTMTHPDGGIAFFNDAALAIAPDFKALSEYASDLGLDWQPQSFDAGMLLEPSGYGRLQMSRAVVIADVGPIGPDYLPGHAHADTLSFELFVGQNRVVVNSGIDRYEAGPERLLQRSTLSHSTVEVDGADSSEVWSSFRVARRARPIERELTIGSDAVQLTCGHDGYRRLPGKVTHVRSWTLSNECLRVHDRLSGEFRQAIARFYLHPGVSVRAVKQKILLSVGGQEVSVVFDGGSAAVVDSTYHPRFGESVPNQCLEVTMNGPSLTTAFHLGPNH